MEGDGEKEWDGFWKMKGTVEKWMVLVVEMRIVSWRVMAWMRMGETLGVWEEMKELGVDDLKMMIDEVCWIKGKDCNMEWLGMILM